MKRMNFLKLFAVLCLGLLFVLPISASGKLVGTYYVDADKIKADYWYTGYKEQGFYVLYAKGHEARELGQPFFERDEWFGGMKFSLKAGGIPLPPDDKPYVIKGQTFHGRYYEVIIIQTKKGRQEVPVTAHPKEESAKKIAELTAGKAPKMNVKLPAPIIGKGISFKLSFEEAYGKALRDLLYNAKKGGYLPPFVPVKFQLYKQNIVPLIGTFPPHYALEVYLIAPWPQD